MYVLKIIGLILLMLFLGFVSFFFIVMNIAKQQEKIDEEKEKQNE